MESHYKVLGISETANTATIEAAYQRLTKRWHPDQNLDNLDEAKLKFEAIQRSYDFLSDAKQKFE